MGHSVHKGGRLSPAPKAGAEKAACLVLRRQSQSIAADRCRCTQQGRPLLVGSPTPSRLPAHPCLPPSLTRSPAQAPDCAAQPSLGRLAGLPLLLSPPPVLPPPPASWHRCPSLRSASVAWRPPAAPPGGLPRRGGGAAPPAAAADGSRRSPAGREGVAAAAEVASARQSLPSSRRAQQQQPQCQVCSQQSQAAPLCIPIPQHVPQTHPELEAQPGSQPQAQPTSQPKASQPTHHRCLVVRALAHGRGDLERQVAHRPQLHPVF